MGHVSVVAYGAGLDSTAMLVGLHARGERPDLVLFADPGGEWPETYAYLDVMQAWLASVGFPAIVTVRAKPTTNDRGTYATLEGNCRVNRTLPSLAFGRKACSLKWKRAPQDAYCRRWAPAVEAWKRGERVTKLIGYDAGPKDARRSKLRDDRRYVYRYPLREWGWDRARCAVEVERAGLPLPHKSACFFCPSTKPHELADLVARYPELADRIIAMEDDARPNLRTCEGLWRATVQGKRGAVPHPGSMAQFIREQRGELPVVSHRSLPLWEEDACAR